MVILDKLYFTILGKFFPFFEIKVYFGYINKGFIG